MAFLYKGQKIICELGLEPDELGTSTRPLGLPRKFYLSNLMKIFIFWFSSSEQEK